MTKKKTFAALALTLSLAGMPALTSAAFAQGAPEPMKGADPIDKGADQGGMDKGGMDKGAMPKKTMSKKSMMKKHKKAM